jgi:Tol biopolymer transport system component
MSSHSTFHDQMRMRLYRKRGRRALPFLFLSAAIVLSGAGCSPNAPNRAEDRGTLLTPPDQVRGSSQLLWSVNTNEIIFVSMPMAGPFTLKAVNITTKAIRSIDTTSREYGRIVLSRDGTQLYFVAMQYLKPGDKLYSVNVDGSTPSREMFPDTFTSDIAYFQDSSWIAYRQGRVGSSDSVVVFNAATGTQKCKIAAPSANPYDFSSDGKHLICIAGSNSISNYVFIVDLAGARFDVVNLPVTWQDGNGFPRLLWMEGDTLIEGYQGIPTTRFFVVNVNNGKMLRTWGSDELIDNIYYFWTPDGQGVALWSAPVAFGFSTLRLLDVNSSTEQNVCSANTAGGNVAFCPTGKGIAYVIGGDIDANIYIKDISWKQ